MMLRTMKNQEELAARFSYAQRVWLATMHVSLYRDKNYLQSRALVRTTSGVADKRDIVAFCRQSCATTGRRFAGIEPGFVLAAICVSTLIGLFLLTHSLYG